MKMVEGDYDSQIASFKNRVIYAIFVKMIISPVMFVKVISYVM